MLIVYTSSMSEDVLQWQNWIMEADEQFPEKWKTKAVTMYKEQSVLPPMWLSRLQVFALWFFTEKQK